MILKVLAIQATKAYCVQIAKMDTVELAISNVLFALIKFRTH